MNEPSVLDQALDYAEYLGFAVFPVGPDCRVPRCAHGYKDASKDPDAIRALWAASPDANVALSAGPVSGVFVLDVDVKELDGRQSMVDMQARNAQLPRTWTAATPSGGWHLFFAHPDRELRNRVGFLPGLDIRAAGGSVALAPSEKANGRYRWLINPFTEALANAPAWLLDLIDPPAATRPNVPPLRVSSSERAARYVTAAVDGECRDLACMGPGTGRNARLFQAAANLGELVGAGLLPQDLAERALEAAAHDCGLTKEDGAHAVRMSIASGMKRGLSNPREVVA